MSKFRDIQKGARAVKTAYLRQAVAPLPGAPSEVPDRVALGLRVLSGEENLTVLQKAKVLATTRGSEKWNEQDPVCAFSLQAHTVFAAAVDIDNHDDPFFESVEEMLNSPVLGADTIGTLYDQQQRWQDECSILKKDMELSDVFARIRQIAEGDPHDSSPLDDMRPGLLWIFMRTLVGLLWTFLTTNSASTSASVSGGTAPSDSSAPTPLSSQLSKTPGSSPSSSKRRRKK